DSTNAERSGRSGSERDLHAPFERIFGEAPGRIVVANFASNIHRIQHLVRMAVQFDRKVAVVGRSLQTNFKTARELGFLDVPEGLTIQLESTERIAPSKLLLLTAGSQGEPMSALAREAGIDAANIVVVEDGETVELEADSMRRGEKINTGLVFVDGLGVGDVEQVVLRDRRHLAEDGILVVNLVLDRDTGAVRAGP